MSNLDGPITALLAVEVVAFGLVLCFVAGGKTDRARGLIIVLFVATCLPLAISAQSFWFGIIMPS